MTRSQVLATATEPVAAPAAPVADAPSTPSARYSLIVTRDRALVHAAQRLRHDVFAVEQGAQLAPGAAADAGRDADAFDDHCDHLVVREDATGAVVGTYRMLTPEGARAAGGLYSDTEFHLGALEALRPRTVAATAPGDGASDDDEPADETAEDDVVVTDAEDAVDEAEGSTDKP